MTLADQASEGFISYTRKDNASFRGVVEVLRDDIMNTIEARTGRSLTLFLDRESIGWGEDWREKIQQSVETATLFIPIITMRYFQSEACRDELLAFHEAAKRRGLTGLILPIVLMGAENITRKDDRPEVRLIEALNYKQIETEFRSGFDSPPWLRVIGEIASDLVMNLQAAEDFILSTELPGEPPAGPSGSHPPGTGSGPDVTDGAELPQTNDFSPSVDDRLDLAQLGAAMEEVTNLAESAAEAVTEIGQIAEQVLGGINLEAMPPKRAHALFIRAADALSQPAVRLEERGKALEERITEVDASLRSIVDELREIDNDQSQAFLSEILSGIAEIGEMEEVSDQMDDLASTMQVASVLNVGLRRSLQPAIRGIRAVQTSARTFGSWNDLLN
ncbi:TIR domain-containing protein [Aeromicrobium sp. Leaf272]|uniref:TIR domain-containing protein n=1 Tax=Aeromicrobium sp. Leaf272 TaxID=1736317 RepID=UPI00138EEEEF|nr:TIR domain-containing protein [Aeromicrobium sp. Leaf272]